MDDLLFGSYVSAAGPCHVPLPKLVTAAIKVRSRVFASRFRLVSHSATSHSHNMACRASGATSTFVCHRVHVRRCTSRGIPQPCHHRVSEIPRQNAIRAVYVFLTTMPPPPPPPSLSFGSVSAAVLWIFPFAHALSCLVCDGWPQLSINVVVGGGRLKLRCCVTVFGLVHCQDCSVCTVLMS